MNTLIIDKKKYVVIPQEDYKKLMKKAAINTPSARKLSLAEGKSMAYSMIDKWHKGKWPTWLTLLKEKVFLTQPRSL